MHLSRGNLGFLLNLGHSNEYYDDKSGSICKSCAYD